MRTADLSDPSSWRAWNGAAYAVSFVSPYTMAPGTEAEHVCTVTNLPNCPVGGWVWSTWLSKYIATLDCSLQSGEQFYFATSDDLITWSASTPFYSNRNLPKNASAMVTSMSYPAFIDPSATDINFQTIGRTPFLSWVSIGHSPYTDGRRLWITPMQFD